MAGVDLAGMWANGGDELLRKLWPDPRAPKREIMRRIGVAVDTLERRAAFLGLKRPCLVDHLAPQVREMAATMTTEQISHELNVCVPVIRNVLGRHGITAQRQQKGLSPELIASARRLWDEGLSTVAIGGRLGVTKNAIIGMAHRHQFPSRKSPIRRTEGAAPKSSYAARKRRRALKHMNNAQITERRETQPVRRVRPEPKQEARVLHLGRVKECCWPIGEPGTREFRFCGDPTPPTKHYCGEHHALAYVKVKDRRADASGFQDRTGAARRSPEAGAIPRQLPPETMPGISSDAGHLLGEVA